MNKFYDNILNDPTVFEIFTLFEQHEKNLTLTEREQIEYIKTHKSLGDETKYYLITYLNKIKKYKKK